MKSLQIFSILTLIFLTSCNKDKANESKTNHKIEMTNINFTNTIDSIRTSDIYENPKNWKARGLMPSGKPVILILRKATNDFLDKLQEICRTNENSDEKLKLVSEIVNELPWDDLDTEEKEFLTDTIAPAVEAAGFNPVEIF